MYETKRAFTYLLLIESVANDVINVSLFAHDKIALKTQNVNNRRQDIDKLECGPMPNVMAALSNTGGALCSTPQFGCVVTLPRRETR